MGCNSSKSSPAVPKATLLSATTDEAKKISDYTTMLASSNPDDVKAALGALSYDCRRKLVEALNGIKEPPTETLAEAPENREKLEGDLAGVEPIDKEPTQAAKDAPVGVAQHETKEERDFKDPVVVETATAKVTGRFCC